MNTQVPSLRFRLPSLSLRLPSLKVRLPLKRPCLHHLRLFLPLLGLLAQGCAEEQDFDQYDDLNVTPTLEASLLYVETPEAEINRDTDLQFIQQAFNFDAFAENFVADNLLDGVVTYEIENTTSKPLEIRFEYLDAADNVLDTEFFSLPPAPTAVLRREVAYGGLGNRPIDIIRNTSAIRVGGENLGDNTSVSSLPDPRLILRSSAAFRIRLK